MSATDAGNARKRNESYGHDETTPLLPESQGSGSTKNVNGSHEISSSGEGEHAKDSIESAEDNKPQHSKQVMLLCLARLSEPISYFSIFPFVQEMVVSVGNVEASKVGFYSGLIESLFSLIQMVLMIPWGRASDRFGRQPILLVSLCGMMVFCTLFGFSQAIWQMMLFRCLAGVFAGSVVTVRTMIAEHSTPKTQATYFSWWAFSNNVGIFIGPFIGGSLADPAHQYPSAFGGVPFFERFPYALPTLATGVLTGLGALIVAFFIHETKPKKSETAGVEGGEQNSEERAMSILQLLRAPNVLTVLAVYGTTYLLAFAYTAVVPVFWFTPVELGGCEFEPLMISIFLAAGGAFQCVYSLVLFPPLQRRFGTKKILQVLTTIWPFIFLLHPFGNLLLKGGHQVAFWILMSFCLFAISAVCMTFIGVTLLINDAAPSPRDLALINSISLAVMAGTRAFAPVLFNSIFASSVTYQILGGQLVWIILAIGAAITRVLTSWLP